MERKRANGERGRTRGADPVRGQLRALKKALDGMAHAEGPGEEAVHDARVQLRRSAALLRLLDEGAPQKKTRRLLRRLKRALSGPRDAEVALQQWRLLDERATLVDKGVAEAVEAALMIDVSKGRRQAARKVARESPRLLKRMRAWADGKPEVPDDLDGRLERVAVRVLKSAAALTRAPSWSNLHVLRKRVRQLRYQLEAALALGVTGTAADVEKFRLVQEVTGDALDAHIAAALHKGRSPPEVVMQMHRRAESELVAIVDACGRWAEASSAVVPVPVPDL